MLRIHRGLILFAGFLLILAALACRAEWQVGPWASTPTPSPTQTATPMAAPAATLTPTPTKTPLPPTSTLAPTNTPLPTISAGLVEVFDNLWQVIKDEYLYQDFNGNDWDAVYQEYRQRIQAGLTEDEFYQAMNEMIDRLGDEHSNFLNPEQVKEEEQRFAGQYDYVGIGVIAALVEERQRATIFLVFPGSPAEEARLKAHDSILEVNGLPIVEGDEDRRSQIRGPEGTTVELLVQSPGEPPRTVSIPRRKITGERPLPTTVLTSPDGKRIGYVFLTTFNETTIPENVKEALISMSADDKLDGLIIDNRFNEGGVSTVVEEMLSYFQNGTLGHFINRQGELPLRVKGRNVAGSQKLPLVVLVGKETASFGEIFSGILQDTRRAYLIGETTGGNVEILYGYDFSDGSRLWMAHDTFRPLNHAEEDWEKSGIIPELTVLSNWDETTLETDPVVQAALQHFDR